MPQEPRDGQMTIRLPKRIRKALNAEADRDRRTPSDIINYLLGERYPLRRKAV